MLDIILAATATTSAPAPAAVYEQAISVALPSLDTGRGVQIGYERWLPERLSLIHI